MGCCSGMCKTVLALLLLLAGLAMFLNLNVAGLASYQVVGGLFILIGLAKLVHCFGMCPSCKDSCK